MANIPLDFVLIYEVGQHALDFIQIDLLAHPLKRAHESVQTESSAVLQLEDSQKEITVGDHLHLLEHEVHAEAHEVGLVGVQDAVESADIAPDGRVPELHELSEPVGGGYRWTRHHSQAHLQ